MDMPTQELEGRLRELARVVEALIFAANEPVEAEKIASVFSEVTEEVLPSSDLIQEMVDKINAAYEQEGRVLRIQRWAGGFRMATTQEVAPYLKSYLRRDRRHKLTRSLMETLAILCYRQPVTKPQVDAVRGVDSDYALRRLLDIGFVCILGRSDSVGRPLLYGTTDFFLEEFGLSDLNQLPNLREIEELLGSSSFDHARAGLLLRKSPDHPPSDDTQEAH